MNVRELKERVAQLGPELDYLPVRFPAEWHQAEPCETCGHVLPALDLAGVIVRAGDCVELTELG